MNNLKKIAAAAAIFIMSIPMLLSAQTFEDHTKIRQLIGKPPAIPIADVPSCPSGSTLSGGQCVLISNQAASGPYVCTQYEWVATSSDTGFIGSYSFPSTTDKTAVTWKDNYYAPGSVRCYKS